MGKRAKEMRQHILDVASILFYQRGIRAVGVDTVVAEAGIAKMTLYSHFQSKDELIAAYLAQVNNRRMSFLRDEMKEATEKTPLEKILLLFDLYEAKIHSDEFRGCPFINGTAEITDASHPAKESIDAYCRDFRSLLYDLVKEADVKNPEKMTDVLWIIISGCLSNSLMTGDKEQIHHVRSTVQQLLNESIRTSH